MRCEGEERSDGGLSFDKAAQGLLALKALGIEATAPDWAGEREIGRSTTRRNRPAN